MSFSLFRTRGLHTVYYDISDLQISVILTDTGYDTHYFKFLRSLGRCFTDKFFLNVIGVVRLASINFFLNVYRCYVISCHDPYRLIVSRTIEDETLQMSLKNALIITPSYVWSYWVLPGCCWLGNVAVLIRNYKW